MQQTHFHNVSWKLIALLGFVECHHCFSTTAPFGAVPQTDGHRKPQKRAYFILSKIRYALKVLWVVVTVASVCHQFAETFYGMATTATGITDVMRGLRWRLKQLAALFTLYCLWRRRAELESVCQRREQFETLSRNIVGEEKYAVMVEGMRKFGRIFNFLSITFLAVTHVELAGEYITRYHSAVRVCPYTHASVTLWTSEVFFWSTTDILTFIPYFAVTWWCTLIHAAVRSSRALREGLKIAAVTHGTSVGTLWKVSVMVRQYFLAVEGAFSGILFWHITAAVLTGLSFLGDMVDRTRDSADGEWGHWLTALVTPQLLIWNILILVGIPTMFAIQFQEEMETLTDVILEQCQYSPGTETSSLETRMRMDFKMDLLILQKKPLAFTGLQYFFLDKGFIVTLVGFVTTYAVVIFELVKNDVARVALQSVANDSGSQDPMRNPLNGNFVT
ncbi:hypothetical protein BV898_12402 [Hypsibius exemplaris]|uniref:Gustatory receptor n=1 Tax=Hypsibius exemplaris TaxID=2072580 RepID=A0A1W0WDU9_HYPEX|nr:hypothetical protein BV898_12402 [Hypsibius exemplaris]